MEILVGGPAVKVTPKSDTKKKSKSLIVSTRRVLSCKEVFFIPFFFFFL